MINKETVNSIAPLVGTFAGAPLALLPVPESILSALCTASNAELATSYTGEVGFHEEWLGSLRNATVYGTRDPIPLHDPENGTTRYLPSELHDKTMEEAANVVADAVVRGINYTKTVVKPTINSFLEHLEANLEVKGAIKNPYNIVPIVPTDAWDSNIVAMALEPLTKTQKPVIVTRNRIPSVVFTDEAIDGYTTGNKKLDSALDKILASKDMTRNDLARTIFNSQGDIGSFTIYNRKDGDLYLAKFILVNMLADNPPSVSMSLDQWQTLLLNLSQAYGALCGHHQRVMEMFRGPKNLIMDFSVSDNTIFVDAPTYDAWLTTGGTPEVLMGAMLVRRTKNLPFAADADDLTAQATTYNLAYSRFNASEQHAERARRVIRVRDALRTSLTLVLGEIDIEMMPQGTNLNAVAAEGNKFIAKLPDYRLDNFGMLGTQLVCELIYPFTNSIDILGRMTGYIDGGMTAQEAERVTVMDYITDWTLDGIKVG